MDTLFAATIGPFLRQNSKSSSLFPLHVLTLAVSVIQTYFILFVPSSPSSGNDSFTLTINTVHSTRTLPTPTTKTPTRTTPHISVERPNTFGFYLTFCTLLVGLLFSLAMVCSRTGRKPTDPNHPPPRRNPRRGQGSAPPPPPANHPTNNDDPEDGTDTGDSNPDNSGNGDPGNGDGNGDDSNDTTDEQEADSSQSGRLLHDEPNPEDPPPPPPPPPISSENDDDPKVPLHGPALSLLHFLLGAAAGLLTRLVTMNATKYRRELQRLFRNITSHQFSMNIGSSGSRFSDLSTVETPCSCQHRPFVVATAQPRNSPRPRRIKVSLPAPFTGIIVKYIPDAIARVSRTYSYLAGNIRPLVNWLIHAMAQDLVVVEACISLAIDRIRAVDIEHGSSFRLIAGCTVLVLVVLEVYHAGLPADPPNTANTDLDYGDDILFPFADVDLPLDASESLQLQFAGHPDPTDHSEDNSTIFPFHDVDLPLAEAESNNPGTVQTPIADPIATFEHNDGAISTNEIEPPISEPEIEQPGQAVEVVSMDCMSASPSGSPDVEQAEIPEANHDIHEANDTLTDELLSTTSNEDSSSNADAYALATEGVQSEEIATKVPSGEESHTDDEATIEEDVDRVLECLAGLFDSSSTNQGSSEECTSAHVLATEDEEIAARMPSREDSHAEDGTSVEEDPDTILECLVGLFDSSSTNQSPSEEFTSAHVLATEDEGIAATEDTSVEEDPDTILECLADFFDSPMDQNSSQEESVSRSPVQNEVPVSPRRASGGVCIRAFTSCEAFAAMFGFENERPLEFLGPLPARLERLLPPYSIFPSTPARYFTLGAPPATPTTPYDRWVKEEHQNTPFIPSPFGPPRTPPQPPPTIVIPSPTSSEGTQPPDESPAAIRARRLDRKWAKIMAKRQRNEARNLVPRVRIEETSFSSSIASDTSIRSFFDPHASINRGIRDAKVEVGPSKPTKWKPRSPGDPAPRQRRRWRSKDVLVGAGEDESYGAVGVAVD